MIIGGRGYGKTVFSKVVIEAVSDGDLESKNGSISYSTSPREVVTVSDMEKFYNYYNRKGVVVDESI